eukprot:scaffold22558_cov116-Cylindrotheca_fusiformis.AAC.8
MQSYDEEQILHRKRLAQILRYIASWHQALNSGDSANDHSFVRSSVPSESGDFFQSSSSSITEDNDGGCGVLFSTANFRTLLLWEAQEENLFPSPPFSFYAANAGNNNNTSTDRKRSLTGALKSTLSPKAAVPADSSHPEGGGGIYWLRLTRLTRAQRMEQPQPNHPVVQHFLQDWIRKTPNASSSYSELLSSSDQIDRILKTDPSRPIKLYLKRYKKYLLTNRYQEHLEPMYNRLFEWIQQKDQHQELVWSLGHAKLSTGDYYIDGPLLDVLVEVELAPDGALLVKPRQHTGVSLNRQVVAALSNSQEVLSKWHRTVSELEASQFSPGQPSTYVPILKQLAVELCPGGSFQASSSSSNARKHKNKNDHDDDSTLVVSEAWCLYTRLKPGSVWARDANLLADQMGSNGQKQQESDLELPLAAWSLTHGPSVLEEVVAKVQQQQLQQQQSKASSLWNWLPKSLSSNKNNEEEQPAPKLRPMFPLATSDAQNRIAELLLDQNYPAVVAEGPPGTGKTHSISNLVCAYLCQGKRVLVTSKNPSALAVLRDRLPASVQELCVDVSKSESSGMRQLQQTVERLANRVSVASAEIETQKTNMLRRSIQDLEEKLQVMDTTIQSQGDRIRNLLQQSDGAKLAEVATNLIREAPWLVTSLRNLEVDDLKSILVRLKELRVEDEAVLAVDNFDRPPKPELVSMVLAKSGTSFTSSIANASRKLLSSIPFISSVVGMEAQRKATENQMEQITLHGVAPESNEDWATVANALRFAQKVSLFENEVWAPKMKSHKWPSCNFFECSNVSKSIELFEMAIELKQLENSLRASNEMDRAEECRNLDRQRGKLQNQVRQHAEELVDAAVVAELSKSFSPDAESALIRFAQIAGANKFGKSAKPSKMTQRQRRRRQEYLDAFDKCCRFIPCWIMTTGQISDYLPAECLFDLVIIDEASQSDVTVLPGMLRGKQWLIVGDGKQVSPTEAFVSEEEIDNLRAALPQSPFERSLMPGQSFFDLCAQAFPRGRVVLSEHFRCAPDIIDFSNKQFYDDRLVPLRLPRQSERLSPSLLDVRVNGRKSGKTNAVEADKIVEMIQEHMNLPGSDVRPRSIGVISLIGDEQSRLIRGRLLDAVGPEKIARHDVLIGDPPTFQGAERDIVFLSMVCSRGSVPTQSQLMHFQRANVAMSRARDRCVLVRSIDLTDISSLDDMKVPIIEHFLQEGISAQEVDSGVALRSRHKIANASLLLKGLLQQSGYTVTDMGVIWKNGICVEDGNTRAALLVDGDELSAQEWLSSYSQQKAIERVGWKCFRIDALSLFVNLDSAMKNVDKFLIVSNITRPVPVVANIKVEMGEVEVEPNEVVDDLDTAMEAADANVPIVLDDEEDQAKGGPEVVTISVSDEEDEAESKPASRPDRIASGFDFAEQAEVNEGRFGQVVELDFLRQMSTKGGGAEYADEVMIDFSPNAEQLSAGIGDAAGHSWSQVRDEGSDEEAIAPAATSKRRRKLTTSDAAPPAAVSKGRRTPVDETARTGTASRGRRKVANEVAPSATVPKRRRTLGDEAASPATPSKGRRKLASEAAAPPVDLSNDQGSVEDEATPPAVASKGGRKLASEEAPSPVDLSKSQGSLDDEAIPPAVASKRRRKLANIAPPVDLSKGQRSQEDEATPPAVASKRRRKLTNSPPVDVSKGQRSQEDEATPPAVASKGRRKLVDEATAPPVMDEAAPPAVSSQGQYMSDNEATPPAAAVSKGRRTSRGMANVKEEAVDDDEVAISKDHYASAGGVQHVNEEKADDETTIPAAASKHRRLRPRKSKKTVDTSDDEEGSPPVSSVARLSPIGSDEDDDVSNFSNSSYSSDESAAYSKGSSKRSRRSKYRKLDKYSRDGRWYPNRKEKESDVEIVYDTDSDLPKIPKVETVDEE